jgi:hypothetical protein
MPYPDDYIPLAYYSDLELNIGVACFCMPAARVVLRRYFPNCGLATTGHDSVEDRYANSQVRHLGAGSGGGVGKNGYGNELGHGHSKTLSSSVSGGGLSAGKKVKVPAFVSVSANRSKRGRGGVDEEDTEGDGDEVELRPYRGREGERGMV